MEALATSEANSESFASEKLLTGYRETEVGIIPNDWSVRSLNQLCDMKSGNGITSKNITDSAPYRCYGGNGLRGFTDNFTHDGTFTLIGRQGALCGNVIEVSGKFFASEHAIVATAKQSTSQHWLTYVLHRLNLNRLSESSAQPGLSVSKVLSVVAAVPPTKAEQQAIAEALSDAEALIEGLEKLIAKKRLIKQGAMQELLTGKRRLPGFSGEWVSRKLGSLGVFLKGSGVKKDQAQSGNLPCVRYGEIYTDHHDVLRKFRSFISHEVAATATRIKAGDILFAGSGETKDEIGKCVAILAVVEAYAGGDIVILRTTGYNSAFLGYALNLPEVQRQKASKGQGDAVVHISASALGSIDIALPDQNEQAAIAEIISEMDSELETLVIRLSKARQIKQGMMQELLTGSIRLV